MFLRYALINAIVYTNFIQKYKANTLIYIFKNIKYIFNYNNHLNISAPNNNAGSKTLQKYYLKSCNFKPGSKLNDQIQSLFYRLGN